MDNIKSSILIKNTNFKYNVIKKNTSPTLADPCIETTDSSESGNGGAITIKNISSPC